jgi:hypothetical protein
MDRATAIALIQHLRALDGPLNSATELTRDIADPDERRRIRRELGQLILQIHANLTLPIVRQYPDLDPERDKGEDQEERGG